MLAMGAAKWFAASETFGFIAHLMLAFVAISVVGLVGAGVAFASLYVILTLVVFGVSHRLIQFRWSAAVLRLLATASAFITLAAIGSSLTHGLLGATCGVLLTAAATAYSVRGLARRSGPDSRMVRMVMQLPFGKRLCGQ